jgi:hypothetical protein
MGRVWNVYEGWEVKNFCILDDLAAVMWYLDFIINTLINNQNLLVNKMLKVGNDLLKNSFMIFWNLIILTSDIVVYLTEYWLFYWKSQIT